MWSVLLERIHQVIARWVDDSPYDPDFPFWTRAYIREMSPGPLTPLSWDLFWNGPAAEGWRDLMVDRMGFTAGTGSGGDAVPRLIGAFGGHVYLNASVLQVWSDRMPALAPNHIDTAYLVGPDEIPPYVPLRWHRPSEAVGLQLAGWLNWVLVDRSQRELDAGRVLSLEAAANRPGLSELSDGDLVERALSLQPLCRVLASQHLNQTLAASIGPAMIAAVCGETGQAANAPLAMAGLGDVESVAPARVMWALSRQVRASPVLEDLFMAGPDNLYRRLRASDAIEVVGFLAGFDALLREVGFRGGDDWDVGAVSWREEPRTALAAIDRLRRCPDSADPAAASARWSTERDALVAGIGEEIQVDPGAHEHFTAAVAATSVFLRGRDRAKANVTRVLNEMRAAVTELAARAADHGDVAEPANMTMLFADELLYYADGGLADVRSITDQRRVHYDELSRVAPPSLLRSPPSASIRRVRPVEPLASALQEDEILSGRPGSPGVGRGRCRIITSAADAARAEPGEVLVAATTSPSWIPFLVGAAGLVIEHGTGLSHTVVAARELGLPVVVSARQAQDRLREGALLEVDGVTGMVTVIGDASPSSIGNVAERNRTIDPGSSRSDDIVAR